MTKSMLHLDDSAAPVGYESTLKVRSRCSPGVTYTICRMSFGRRMELVRRIREISGRLKFLESSGDFEEKVDANLLAQQIEELYLRWGLTDLDGLTIDGQSASTDLLIQKGPEELSLEIASAIKAQCGLTEQERKN